MQMWADYSVGLFWCKRGAFFFLPGHMLLLPAVAVVVVVVGGLWVLHAEWEDEPYTSSAQVVSVVQRVAVLTPSVRCRQCSPNRVTVLTHTVRSRQRSPNRVTVLTHSVRSTYLHTRASPSLTRFRNTESYGFHLQQIVLKFRSVTSCKTDFF